MDVRNRRTFFVKQVFDGSISKFQTFIDIPFQADVIIIRQLTTGNRAVNGEDDCYTLRWDGVGDLVMFCMEDNTTNPNITIDMRGKQILGIQSFSTWDGEMTQAKFPTCSLGLVFEAVQY